MTTLPPRLHVGSSVRVVAPSRSLSIIGTNVPTEADRRLAGLGLRVGFQVPARKRTRRIPPLVRRVSLLHQSTFAGVRALVIGRFQRQTAMTRELLTRIVATKAELADLPVIANVDFGHTTPIFTFPIGGTVEIHAEASVARMKVTVH